MGVVAQASGSILYASTEASWGSTAGGAFATARITGMDIRSRQGYTGSNELVVSREPAPLIRNSIAAEGSVNFELDVQDPVLELFLSSLFGQAWSADYGVTGSIGVSAAAGGVTTMTSAALFTTISAGDWIRTSGFTSATNNGLFYVSAKASSSSITVVNPNAIVQAPTSCSITGSKLVFGTGTRALTMQQKVPSVEVLYEQATGMLCSSLTLDAAVGSMVTGTANFTGKQVVQSTTLLGTTPANAGTGSIASAIDSIKFYEGGTVSGNPVPALNTARTYLLSRASFNIASPVTPQSAIGSLGAAGVRIGRPTVTGTMSIYAEHGVAETNGVKDLHDAYLSGLDRNGLTFIFGANLTTSTAAPTYVFHAQRYNFTNAGLPVGGNDSDLFLEVEWAAKDYASTNNGPTGGTTAFSIFKL